jgi:hypothetical protein
MTAPDPLEVAHQVALEHIAYLRRQGVPLVDAAAAIGASIGSGGWDGLTEAYAIAWHELSQGVADGPDRWDAKNSNGPGALTPRPAGFATGAEAGQSGGARLETHHGFQDCPSAPEFQARRYGVAADFRRNNGPVRLRRQTGRAR